MAHLITGYAGYEHIQSADEGSFNASFFGRGQYVMESGSRFAGSVIDNNTVRISDGDGLMYGRHFRIEPNTYEDMTITTGTAGKNRIDLICATYEKSAADETESVRLEVVKGTDADGTAVAPAYTNGNILEGASFNQMPLYKVTIEGVVLKKIEPMFETLLSYKGLAEYYAGVFQERCDEIAAESPANALTPDDVIDNLESTDTGKPLSANQGRVLAQAFQDGCDKLVADVTAKGVVPASNGVDDIIAAYTEAFEGASGGGELTFVCGVGRLNNTVSASKSYDSTFVNKVGNNEYKALKDFDAIVSGAFFGRDGASGSLKVTINGNAVLTVNGGSGVAQSIGTVSIKEGDTIATTQSSVSNSWSWVAIYAL